MKKHLVILVANILVLSLTEIAKAQNLFLSDDITGNIYEYTPSGARSTFASGLVNPGALAFDSAGNLFVTRSGDIIEITPSGTRSTFASGLTDPRSLAFDGAGDLFEADGSSGNIYKFAPNGTKTIFASVSNWAYGLAFDSAGNLYVANSTQPGFGPNDIIKITPGGTEEIFASGPELDSLAYLAFNSVGDLFYDQGPGSAEGVLELTPNGVPIGTYADGLLDMPGAMAFDSAGNLFVTSTVLAAPGYIYEITPDGTVSIFASGVSCFAGLAIQGIALPVPEPSVWAILGVGAVVVFGLNSKRNNLRLAPRWNHRPLPLTFWMERSTLGELDTPTISTSSANEK